MSTAAAQRGKRRALLGAQAGPPTAEHVDRQTADRGWLQPILLATERLCWGRWDYWLTALEQGELGDAPIPQIPFASLHRGDGRTQARFAAERPDIAEEIGSASTARARAMKTLRDAAFSSGTSASDIVDWLLWACGSHNVERRPALQGNAAIKIYHELRIEDLLAWPGDWGSEIVRELISESYGTRSGWFATPIEICNLMVAMTHHDDGAAGIDSRTSTFTEPCCGTGAIVLPASNHYLRMWVNDIDRTMVRLMELVAWLYIPWLVMPAGPEHIREFAEADGRREAGTQTAMEHTTAPPPPPTGRRGQLQLFDT